MKSVEAEIRELHKKIKWFQRKSVKMAIEIGKMLVCKKKELGHGNWLPWIKKANLGFGYKSAERYIACFKKRAKLDTLSNLTEAYTLVYPQGNPNKNEIADSDELTEEDIEELKKKWTPKNHIFTENDYHEEMVLAKIDEIQELTRYIKNGQVGNVPVNKSIIEAFIARWNMEKSSYYARKKSAKLDVSYVLINLEEVRDLLEQYDCILTEQEISRVDKCFQQGKYAIGF